MKFVYFIGSSAFIWKNKISQLQIKTFRLNLLLVWKLFKPGGFLYFPLFLIILMTGLKNFQVKTNLNHNMYIVNKKMLLIK